jgi:hypothetical protein
MSFANDGFESNLIMAAYDLVGNGNNRFDENSLINMCTRVCVHCNE